MHAERQLMQPVNVRILQHLQLATDNYLHNCDVPHHVDLIKELTSIYCNMYTFAMSTFIYV